MTNLQCSLVDSTTVPHYCSTYIGQVWNPKQSCQFYWSLSLPLFRSHLSKFATYHPFVDPYCFHQDSVPSSYQGSFQDNSRIACHSISCFTVSPTAPFVRHTVVQTASLLTDSLAASKGTAPTFGLTLGLKSNPGLDRRLTWLHCPRFKSPSQPVSASYPTVFQIASLKSQRRAFHFWHFYELISRC